LQPANAIGRSVVAQAPSSGRTTGHTDSLPGMAHRTHLGMSGCPARGTSYGSFRDDPRWCRMVAARGSVCGDGLGSPRHVVLAPVAVPLTGRVGTGVNGRTEPWFGIRRGGNAVRVGRTQIGLEALATSVTWSAQRRGHCPQFVQGRPRVVGKLVLSLTVALGPLRVAPLERKDTQFACEMCRRVGHAAGDEGGCHGGREADALEGVPLLEFGAGGDGRLH